MTAFQKIYLSTNVAILKHVQTSFTDIITLHKDALEEFLLPKAT